MELKYEMKGAERKKLFKAIESLTGYKAKYLGMPSAAYEVGTFTVSKEGTVKSTTDKDLENLEKILANDYEIEIPRSETVVTQGLTVAIPKEKVNLSKLEKILENKGDLIKKALGVISLGIEEDEEKVSFPWFEKIDNEHLMTYTKFIAALCKMSVKAKRINEFSKEVINEKYTFRCFLLRLGFIGDEFKMDRKILLEKLSGSSAFRNGGLKDEISK
ncbi:virulence protein [uncultured Granulicatella sp.]|uniref:virulence protein n=1 Tax=uncultured Granulicatella sp. TaxID=316089 RepID=UPI0028D5F399|nr:virulence protein [uncultured Granulicatella sp.]